MLNKIALNLVKIVEVRSYLGYQLAFGYRLRQKNKKIIRSIETKKIYFLVFFFKLIKNHFKTILKIDLFSIFIFISTNKYFLYILYLSPSLLSF
jgi:hypothetical protein